MLLFRRCGAHQSLKPAHVETLLAQVSAGLPLHGVTQLQTPPLQGPGLPLTASPCANATRSFNARATAAKFVKEASDLFNIPKLMHPEVHNMAERQAAETFKFYGKVMYPYYRKRPLNWNLYANGNEGWDELERRARYFWNRFWIQRVCRQSLWGFSSKGLKEHAIDVYKQVNAAVADGHRGKLAVEPVKELVVPMLFDQLQGEATRLQQFRRRVDWKMVKEPTVNDVKLVNGYLVKAVNNPQMAIKLHFVQWTMEIRSEQTFAVYEMAEKEGRGKLLAGDPNKPIKVVDYWVFERPVYKSWFLPKPGPRGATWRLAARLTQPEGRPPPLAPAPV